MLGPDEAVQSGRLRLGQLVPGDLAPIAPWLETALAPDWEPADLDCSVSAGAGVLFSDAAGEPIGLAVALLDRPQPGTATVPFLTIGPERRFRGLGGEAALALERHLRRKFGVTRVFAPVPDGRGLAVYFWLRLGFKPLLQSEAPWPLVGLTSEARPGIWLARDGE